ncbi:MAG: VWA domain-containing protein [Methylovulum sp.]|uniref:vWA domain-containing protein n=1 Tax=Methylovulum sp. TaxID=1916980 RepID=UPI002612C068|nr:vWA domain-containing protein [Methylovulum sp.]MDD2724147.1 VWA domain-containing protein [Methylovulum sp.]MDD5123179.1 VWA domain-containing protein [Methylovulum sp.]
MIPNIAKNYRFWLLTLALTAMLTAFIRPTQNQPRPIYNYTFIIDITRSMNAADYQLDGQAVSRLDYVKHSLRGLLAKLPCQSKIGLGLFTERRSTLLFEPIEVCQGFNDIDTALAQVDWRMAWAADSRIASGLLNTLQMLEKLGTHVVFITDGQEAPPVNPRYHSDFAAVKGKAKGMVIGAGGLQAVPIPKFNHKGEPDGFYRPDDVPHRSTFGEADLNPENIQGYNARNAPFGSEAAAGSEHLSALQESYLQILSEEAGLHYQRLTTLDDLATALQIPDFAVQKTIAVDVRWQAAMLALGLCVLVYVRIVRGQSPGA